MRKTLKQHMGSLHEHRATVYTYSRSSQLHPKDGCQRLTRLEEETFPCLWLQPNLDLSVADCTISHYIKSRVTKLPLVCGFLCYQTLQSDWIQDGHGQRLMPFHFKVNKPLTGFPRLRQMWHCQMLLPPFPFIFELHQATSQVGGPKCC